MLHNGDADNSPSFTEESLSHEAIDLRNEAIGLVALASDKARHGQWQADYKNGIATFTTSGFETDINKVASCLTIIPYAIGKDIPSGAMVIELERQSPAEYGSNFYLNQFVIIPTFTDEPTYVWHSTRLAKGVKQLGRKDLDFTDIDTKTKSKVEVTDLDIIRKTFNDIKTSQAEASRPVPARHMPRLPRGLLRRLIHPSAH